MFRLQVTNVFLVKFDFSLSSLLQFVLKKLESILKTVLFLLLHFIISIDYRYTFFKSILILNNLLNIFTLFNLKLNFSLIMSHFS